MTKQKTLSSAVFFGHFTVIGQNAFEMTEKN